MLEEQEWTEDAVELYFGDDWGWDRAHSLEGQATAQGTLYQAGSLSGETWSISSYAFDATGSSLETMASQYNSQVQIDTEYHDYTHLATTSHDRRTTSAFTLKERGTLLSSGTFVFTDYELTPSDTALSTKSAETFEYRHTIIPPPPPPLFGTSSWSSKESHGDRLSSENETKTLMAKGTSSVGCFSYSQYDQSQVNQYSMQYTEHGEYQASQNPWVQGSWTLNTSETKTDTRTTTGTGLVGTVNWVVDADHATTKTSWINGNSDTTSASGSFDDTGTSTFTLDAPRPTNLVPKPSIAVSSLAVGENLQSQGLLRGVQENLAERVKPPSGTVKRISSRAEEGERGGSSSPPNAQAAEVIQPPAPNQGVVVPLEQQAPSEKGKKRFDEALFWKIVLALPGGQEAVNWFKSTNGLVTRFPARSWWNLWGMSSPAASGLENRGGFSSEYPVGAYVHLRDDLNELEAALEFMKQMRAVGFMGGLGTMYIESIDGKVIPDTEAFAAFYNGELALAVAATGAAGANLYIQIVTTPSGTATVMVVAGDALEGNYAQAAGPGALMALTAVLRFVKGAKHVYQYKSGDKWVEIPLTPAEVKLLMNK